jgi:hypothetical protein
MSFVYPFVLLAIPAGAGLLLMIYRRKSIGEPARIPTLFLLRHFTAEGGRPRKIFPPIRYFFELLILALLSLAAAGITAESGGKRSVLIIDNSFQTSAVAQSSSRVFDAVTERAREALNTTLASDSVLLIATSPRQTTFTEGFVSSDVATRELSSIAPNYAAGDLSTTISTALNRGDVDRVVVASAQPIEGDESDRDRLILLSVGLPVLQNVAIEKLWNSSGAEISAQIRSFSSNKTDVQVSFSAIDKSGEISSVVRRQVTIDPEKNATITFPISTKNGVGYRARIESPVVGQENALSGDDESWISTSHPPTTIGVVSHIPLRDLNLNRIFGSSLEEISPSNIDISQERVSGWIFHRTAPSKPTGKPTLLILPPPDSAIIRSTPFSNPWSVAIWESSSPFFRYLSPDTLKGSAGALLETGYTFTPLMRGEKGTLIAESFQYDTHTLVLGFEALPFLAKKNAPLSILLLNIMHHLFQDVAGVELNPFRGVASLKGKKARYLISSSQLGGSDQPNSLPVPGLIQISNEKPDSKGASETISSVNFFDEAQSNLLARRPLKLSPLVSNSASQIESIGGMSLVNLFLNILLILIAVDGLFGFISLLRSRRRVT